MEQRTCRKCGTERPITDFRPHKKGGQVHRWTCRPCEHQALRTMRDLKRGGPPRDPRPLDGPAVCTRCELAKPRVEFRPEPRNRDGLRSQCKDCDRKYARIWQKNSQQYKQWVKDNPVAAARLYRRNALKKYGLTLEQYEQMFAAQGGRCAICQRPDPKPRKRNAGSDLLGHNLVVDHCHTTGRVRGLLCGTCNTGIGGLLDDPTVVASALRYLLKSAA